MKIELKGEKTRTLSFGELIVGELYLVEGDEPGRVLMKTDENSLVSLRSGVLFGKREGYMDKRYVPVVGKFVVGL